jgi:hypothetical protein
MGKSIEDILKQIELERSQRINEEQSKLDEINQQRDLARKEWNKRLSIYESISNNSSTSPAGSGGGGGITLVDTPYVIQDADAQEFITTANITTASEILASDNLVIAFKAAGLWNKMTHIYPLVGGTAFTHKFNIKDLRDLDAAYRLSFYGDWTHNNNGITGNGINTYADTYSKTAKSIGIYSRVSNTGVLTGQYGVYFDSEGNAGNPTGLTLYGHIAAVNDYEWVTAGSAPYTKMYTVVDSTNIKIYRNGINAAGNNNFTEWNIASNYVLGAQRIADIDENGIQTGEYVGGFSTANIAFACFSDDVLTPQEAANLDTIVQSFQTTLGRQV